MSWLRIDDGFARHPKIQELTDRELRVWIGILCYCAEYRTGGLVYKQSIGRAVNGATPTVIHRFAELGLLDPTSGANGLQKGSHFQVHNWNEYNGSQDPQAAERMRRYRAEHPRVQGTRWERVREDVYARDGGVCVDCGLEKDDWNADHEPKRAELERLGLSIYDLDYIYTRCHSCHAKKTRREANQPNRTTEPTTEPVTPNLGSGSAYVQPRARKPQPQFLSSSPVLDMDDQNGRELERAGEHPYLTRLLAEYGTSAEAQAKIRRAARGKSEAAIVVALEASHGPGVRDPLAVALAELGKRPEVRELVDRELGPPAPAVEPEPEPEP